MIEKFKTVLKNYLEAPYDSNGEVYSILNYKIPGELNNLINNNNFVCKGSMGKGNKANVPWVAICHKSMTIQKGIYIVYLFKENMNGFYLTLNQGITYFNEKYGTNNARNQASIVSRKIRERLSNSFDFENNIELGTCPLAKGYQATTILAQYYSFDALPSEDDFNVELDIFLGIYENIINDMNGKSYEKYIHDIVNTPNQSEYNKELIRIRDEYRVEEKEDKIMDNLTKISLNTILYGPPGTGKTYNTKRYAVAICENKDVESIIEDETKQKYNDLKENGQIEFVTFHQSYGYEDFIEGIRPIIKDKNTDKERLIYDVVPGVFKAFCDKAKENPGQNYVFIIDEINRGNISKIFGELITLIEESKRKGNDDELEVSLPYSKEKFSIPNNVYILGTMNTADRSIALLDTALRRRFDFIEMMPEKKVISDINVVDKKTHKIINIAALLEKINNRIELLYDREHQIGHSYFIELKNKPTIEKLQHVFEQRIIPLLQEYFYNDYEKIQLVLGSNIIEEQSIDNDIFDSDVPFVKEKIYTINKAKLGEFDTYIKIYAQGYKNDVEPEGNNE